MGKEWEHDGRHGEPEGPWSLLPRVGLAENWFACCIGPTAISSAAPTPYRDGLLHCGMTSGWPLDLSGHSSAQEGQHPPSLSALEA